MKDITLTCSLKESSETFLIALNTDDTVDFLKEKIREKFSCDETDVTGNIELWKVEISNKCEGTVLSENNDTRKLTEGKLNNFWPQQPPEDHIHLIIDSPYLIQWQKSLLEVQNEINDLRLHNQGVDRGYKSLSYKDYNALIETLFTSVPTLKKLKNNLSEYDESRRLIANHFDSKNYMEIFMNTNLRNAYILQYSPPRALCYFNNLYCMKQKELYSLFTSKDEPLQVICLGAGPGGEAVAISLAYIKEKCQSKDKNSKLMLHIQDQYNYESCLKDLFEQMNAKKMDITWNYTMGNIMGIGPQYTGDVGDGLGGAIWDLILGVKGKINLVTACFVANELFSVNIEQAKRFFERLTRAMTPDTLLLILDCQYDESFSIHNNKSLWAYLEKLERTISGNGFKDQIVIISRANDQFIADSFLSDSQYYYTNCNYEYILFKKIRI
ncbi:hypothetical protein C1645_837217 [Glomus cerebriforme]|uniref:Crinkler effector protein N-terminal domain-containing protein n=1 Tax=Glomus cerebriforme TaxID=658196 RepID=A0A397S734_9GLOM|nr:hypothetical protein C1645_837217 [Glomus cerebriforme]